MNNQLVTLEEATAMIRSGERLLISGDISLLKQLPKGDWIGGTTPFFILYPGHQVTSFEKVFVTKLPEYVTRITIKTYDSSDIDHIYNDAEALGNVFTVLIIPFGEGVYQHFALNATYFENFAARPLFGWLSGRPLDTIMTEPSYVMSGHDLEARTSTAVAMHVELPDTKYAELHIFNPYTQGTGDTITFEESGMVLTDALINGQKRNFAEYLREVGFDTRMPFVANYSGEMLNVVCCGITDEQVLLSAPVFPSLEYRIGCINRKVDEAQLQSDNILLSATCIGNFIQPDVCEQYLRQMNGPVVYGEIAYQLLNQTTIYLTIDNVNTNAL